jgi:FkbM family methyltransferase
MSDSGDNKFGYYKPNTVQKFFIFIGRNTPLLKTFFRTRLNRLYLKIKNGPIDYNLFGLNYRFHTYDNLADRKALFTPDKYDRFEREFLTKNIEPHGVFFDIGSNVGVYSLFVSTKRKDIIVHAFEPLFKIAERLKYNSQLNNLNDRLKVNNIALTDTNGFASFSIEKESLVFGDLSGEVQCKTLISFMDENGIEKIHAIKIDVEGAEDKVLKPFFEKSSKNRWPEHIIIEHLFPDIWEWNCLVELEKLGYRSVWVGPMNTIYQKECI